MPGQISLAWNRRSLPLPACIRNRVYPISAPLVRKSGKPDLRRGEGAQAPCSPERLGDGRDGGLDVGIGVIAAEAEADALSAHVGDDAGAGKPLVDRSGLRGLVAEEVPAPLRGDRRHQPGLAQWLDPGGVDALQK